MHDIAFDEPASLSHVALSPQEWLLAGVRNGITVSIFDVQGGTPIPRPQLGSSAHRQHIASAKQPLSPSTASLLQRAPVASYAALDQVSALLWSPDGVLLLLHLAARSCVEIISVLDTNSNAVTSGRGATTPRRPPVCVACVARLDAGVNHVLDFCWHPSSRAVYTCGIAATFLTSLVDGTTAPLEFPAKLTEAAPGRDITELGSLSAATQDSYGLYDRQYRALITVSEDLMLVFVLSGAALWSTMKRGETASNSGGESDHHAPSPRPTPAGRATSWPKHAGPSNSTNVARAQDELTEAKSPQQLTLRCETITVYDATDGGLAVVTSIPLVGATASGVDSVTQFHVLDASLMLFDAFRGTVAWLSMDGCQVYRAFGGDSGAFAIAVHRRSPTSHLCVVATYPSPTTMSKQMGGSAEVHLCMDLGTTIVPLAVVPLTVAYLPPSLVPLLLEKPVHRRDDSDRFSLRTAAAAGMRPSAGETEYVVAPIDVATFDATIASCRSASSAALSQASMRCYRPVSSALVAVSPEGKYVAMVTPDRPTLVVVMDASKAVVSTLLAHSSPVIMLSWRGSKSASGRASLPGAADVFHAWADQSVTVCNNDGDGFDGDRALLAIGTSAIDGGLRWWCPTAAACVSLPATSATLAVADRNAAAGWNRKAMLPAATVQRVLWLRSRNCIFLCDELRGLCVAATIEA